MEYDYIIVGSGFGGSVSALRLVEKGYRVLLLEQGRRFAPKDFAHTNWNLRRWLWLPALGLRGIFKITLFRHVAVLSGVGVGGGSLVYANTLPVPQDGFFTTGPWAKLASWRTELAPHYKTAQRMLGATTNPYPTHVDDTMRELARDLGREEQFQLTDVAVYFGDPERETPDPYFDGEGPPRIGCTACGACMIGCRHGAKNTLDKNYLYLAEKKGLTLWDNTRVIRVRKHPEGGYEVVARRGRGLRRVTHVLRAPKVILAGGVLGTVPLLLRMKNEGHLPKLSPQLGNFVRTNSESLIGVTTRRRDRDYSKGIAISSIIHVDDNASIEPVRYPAGSGFFRLAVAPHVHGRNALVRTLSLVTAVMRHPLRTLRTLLVRDWARYTNILLYMQQPEGHLRMQWRRGLLNLFRGGTRTQVADGPPPTANIPKASELAQRVADKTDGQAMSLVHESILGIPTTAHILGGCCMGQDADEGVIGADHQVHGYEGLYVIDGSAVSSNPGVNPSLTITALAERAMAGICGKEKV